jgi:cbb3-type cytochrome oxidase subunit 1
MDWFVRAFLKASLVWLTLGVSLGVVMAVHPAWAAYRTAHMHMNLLGFVTMMIFGVAYHVLPRFSGSPLFSRTLATAHWWMANLGLSLMVIGFIMRANGIALTAATVVLGTGGVLAALGAYAFAYNIWRTISAHPATPLAVIPGRRPAVSPR